MQGTKRPGHTVQFRNKKTSIPTWSKLSSLTKRSVGTLSMASRDLSLAASEARSTAWYLGMRISGGISQLSSFSSSSVRFTCGEKFFISVADPRHFGVDPDPDLRIYASD